MILTIDNLTRHRSTTQSPKYDTIKIVGRQDSILCWVSSRRELGPPTRRLQVSDVPKDGWKCFQCAMVNGGFRWARENSKRVENGLHHHFTWKVRDIFGLRRMDGFFWVRFDPRAPRL